MNIYKKAVLTNLIFSTNKGRMNIVGVAKLTKEEWNQVAILIYNSQAEVGKSFLKGNVVDETQQLRLALLKDLIKTKENKEAKDAEQAGVREELDEYTDILASKERKDKLKKSTKDIRDNIVRLQGKLD